MTCFGNAFSFHSSFIPFTVVCKNRWGLPHPIARKKDLKTVRSGVLVAISVYNLVYAYKCDNNLETAR